MVAAWTLRAFSVCVGVLEKVVAEFVWGSKLVEIFWASVWSGLFL
jgi:hypothetical protein